MTINANIIADMRNWIDDASESFYWNDTVYSVNPITNENVYNLDDATIINMVANTYAGGIAQFIKDGGF